MKLAWAWLVVAACDSKADPNVCVNCRDADATPIPDAHRVCDLTGESGCSVLTQAGCTSGQKCTYVTDPADSNIGCIMCAPAGAVAVGNACTSTLESFGVLVDDCLAGLICTSGVCRQICDNNGGTPMCASGETCLVVPGLFVPVDMQEVAPAGVCAPPS
jgi:hypothetical protein